MSTSSISSISSPASAPAEAPIVNLIPIPGRVVAVMPAYNAEKTLERTVLDIPAGTVHEIVLVDVVSRDQTVAVAERLGLTVIQHQRNRGYGGNQKTCYQYARSSGAAFVVMIHPDYQYDSRVVGAAVERRGGPRAATANRPAARRPIGRARRCIERRSLSRMRDGDEARRGVVESEDPWCRVLLHPSKMAESERSQCDPQLLRRRHASRRRTSPARISAGCRLLLAWAWAP